MRIQTAKVVAAVTLGFVLLSAHPAHAQDDALKFFKNYFVTGGYKVAGVGLAGQGVDGIAHGVITIDGVPEGAEIVAAFLYAQVVSADGPEAGAAGVTFHGVPLSAPEGTFAVIGDPEGATPCWSSGGGTGQANGTKRTYSYRYDVLRFLPVVNGRQQANGDHPVELPDLGNSNATPIALGASLVLIYRDTENPATPLSAFVIYDGSWAMDNDTRGMTQTIEGFYDPAPVPGEITHIVGSGQANKGENLRVNGTTFVNPFQGFQGEAWDNVTVPAPNLGGADYLTTSVDDEGFPSCDCLTWSAVIYRTEVNDSDNDGLLDIWETSQATLYDPNDQPLPNLAAMGADPFQKDIFVEVGYMETDPATSADGSAGVSYGGVLKPHHTHRPTPEALKKVGDAFQAKGIRIHFDVGLYPDPEGIANPYLVPATYARGGEAYDEMITVCERGPDDPPWLCQFSDYPGTVGWKSGFRTLRDALIDDPQPNVPPGGDHVCDSPTNPGYNEGPGGNCERVFDRNRKDMFRFVFFAHAVGVPKASCLDLDESSPTYGLPDATCQATNPLFHVPNTYSGIGDWGGGDAMVTMGGFSNAEGQPVGTDLQQAGTIMHELGHTMMLSHGGDSENPNCSPNYLSIMNYLFQLRGLVDGDGVVQIDYSSQTLDPLAESFLDENVGLGSATDYRSAWYAPFSGIGSPATKHCNGSPLSPAEMEMARVDGTEVGFSIDWNTDGDTSDTLAQDINFDGILNDAEAPLSGFNDWDNLRLNQVGARRNIGVWFFLNGFPYMGPASLDMTRGDFGQFDFGQWDFGQWDFGQFDFGQFDFGDLNIGDLGQFDFGQFDFGQFDFGQFDFGVGAGDLGRGSDGKGGFGQFDFGQFDFGGGADGELTTAVAVAAGLLGPPTGLTACVAGNPGEPACTEQDGELRVQLEWNAPDASASAYVVYRRADGEVNFAPVGTLEPAGGALATAFVDTTVDYDTTYEYYVAAKYEADGEVNESASNTATVTTGPQLYGFQLIKPNGGKAYNSGSSVPIEWDFLLNGVAVNSSDAQPVITITGPAGVVVFTPEDPGNSSFHPPTDADPSWQYNWQTVDPATGDDLPAGSYSVEIGSQKTGQTFPSFVVKLK